MAMTPAPDPQPPPSIVTRAISGDEIVDRSACNLALFCRTTNAPPQCSRCRISLIRAMRRTISISRTATAETTLSQQPRPSGALTEEVPGFSKPASATRSSQS
jgi:hypothetical protein